MGLFDFLKPKRTAAAGNSSMQQLMLARQLENIKHEIASLTERGYLDEGRQRALEFLTECFGVWQREPSNPAYLTVLTSGAIQLDVPDAGVAYLEVVIEGNEQLPFMDLTMVYCDLGRLYHRLSEDPNKELWAYHMATQSQPPPGCPYPASTNQKARAHNFAYLCANRIRNEDHVVYHDQMRRELVPNLNWDDMMAVVRWMQTAQ